MKTLKIAPAVVLAKGAETQVKCSGGVLEVLQNVNAPVNSRYRKTALSAVKITYAVKALDEILNRKVGLLAGTKDLYVEITYREKLYKGLIKGTKQRWNIMPPDYVVLLGDVMYTVIQEDNPEIKDCTRHILASPGKDAVNSIALFCDSYFFYRKAVEVEYDDSLVEEEISAAIRRGLLGPSFLEAFLIPIDNRTTPDYKGEEEKKQDKGAFIKECMEGAYQIPYEWNDKSYVYGKELLSSYVPTETFEKIVRKVHFRLTRILKRLEEGADSITALGNDYINLTLCGKPGTGKTALIYAVSAATGLPVYTTSASHNTDEDEFEGKTKMVDGHPSAVPTDALKAFKNGGICLIEEANLPQAAVIMGALGQAIEFPFILKEDGYKTIRRHPLCIFITTMNVGTVGAKAMSQPFANRFRQSYILNDPDPSVFVNILEKRTAEDKKLCKWVYSAYESVLRCLDKNDGIADVESIKLALSMRSCIGAIENIQEGEHPKDAVKDSVIGKIAEQDLEMAETCLRAVDALPDYRG